MTNLILDESLPFVGREKYMHKRTPKYRVVLYMNYQDWVNALHVSDQSLKTKYRRLNASLQFVIDYMNGKYEDNKETKLILDDIYYEYIEDGILSSVFKDGAKLRCSDSNNAKCISNGDWHKTNYVRHNISEIGKLKNITTKEAKALLDLEAVKKY